MLLLFFSFLIQASFHVVIDPGHGGEKDKGAVYKKYKESVINLEIAKRLERKLKKDAQFKVSLTRRKDQFIPLPERLKKIKDVDFLLSLHINSSYNPQRSGAEFFLAKPIEKTKTEARLQFILEDLKSNVRLKKSATFTKILLKYWKGSLRKNPVKQKPFFILTESKSPSVLIEMGFLSHPQDRKKLSSPKHQEKIASFLYKAIKEYKELDKLKTPVHKKVL